MKKNNRESEIERLMYEGNTQSHIGRLNRLKFLLSIEGPDEFPTPVLAGEYYEEARLCWYAGAYVATIVMVQLSFEELLRSHYRALKGIGGKLRINKKIDNARFYDLINEAENNKWVTKEEAKLLHSFRKNIRNPFVHAKDIKLDKNGKTNLNEQNFFIQTIKIKAPEVLGSNVMNDAKESIQLLVTLFPKISNRYFGL
jgi:hypothetical protein